MSVSSKCIVITAAVLAIAIDASAQGRPTFELPAARTSQQAGGTLTPPSNASPVAVLAQYLRDHGRDEATVRSVVETSRGRSRNGIVQGRYEQRAGGLAVYGTYAKAAFNSRGELVSLIENFVPIPASMAPAGVSAQQAVEVAVRNLYPDLVNRGAFFRSAPSATRVAVPRADGSLAAGYLVETWTRSTNELNETLVSGDGSVLNVESRTNNDSYNVFTRNPNQPEGQTVVSGPTPSPIAPSRLGWLGTGSQKTVNIGGNNVAAYLDIDANNAADSGGTTVNDGNFLTAFDAATSPSNTQNRSVAVQNLFYLNNVMHDQLYSHGFDEAAGNFQNDNFSLGGAGNDAVNAEGQDGSGTDNANFATPTDGSHPRMQMYLWTGRGTHQVVVGIGTTAQTFLAQGAQFGPALTTTGVTFPLALVNDSGGVSSTDACESIASGSLSNKIAIVDRGNCDFTVKVRNAQSAGAKGVIVANNQGDSIMTMGGSDRKVTIPSVFVGRTDGTTLKGKIGTSTTIRLNPVTPLQRDGDVDSDVVFHEYCHGLTWRMIGSMSGPIAGAIGEGMSDVCAMLMNGDDVIGEYSYSDPGGIRRHPYATYSQPDPATGWPGMTYGDMNSGEVHNDGEAYAAIGWRLREKFANRESVLWDYIVDGMNFTPAAPTYEQMRDGILSSISNAPDQAGDDCLVWQAFAEYGVGVAAKATIRGTRVSITESFTLPSNCSQ